MWAGRASLAGRVLMAWWLTVAVAMAHGTAGGDEGPGSGTGAGTGVGVDGAWTAGVLQPRAVDALVAGRRQRAVESALVTGAQKERAVQSQLATLEAELVRVNGELAVAESAVAAARSKVDQGRERLSAARADLARVLVGAYTSAGTGSEIAGAGDALLAVRWDRDVASRQVLGSAALAATHQRAEAARDLVAGLEASLADAQQVQQQVAEVAGAAQTAVRAVREELGRERSRTQEAVALAGQVWDGTPALVELTVMGDTLVSAEDMAAFVASRGRPHPGVDVVALAELFVQEGQAEGVRADVAFVQSILETGWFSYTGSMVAWDDYNYAGIGACDSCTRGYLFADEREGVRAQMQLLRTYATKGLTSADLAHPPARLRPESSSVRGCCASWMALSGVWATGTSYGVKILTLYRELVDFAGARASARGE